MEASLRAIETRAQFTRFLVIRDGGAIVGSIGYCPAGKGNPEIFPPDWAAVLLLAVAPVHRGRGLARTLVSACIECARNDSARTIGLFTSELMTAAHQLYESFGFRRESELVPRLGLRYWRYKLPLIEPAASIHRKSNTPAWPPKIEGQVAPGPPFPLDNTRSSRPLVQQVPLPPSIDERIKQAFDKSMALE